MGERRRSPLTYTTVLPRAAKVRIMFMVVSVLPSAAWLEVIMIFLMPAPEKVIKLSIR